MLIASPSRSGCLDRLGRRLPGLVFHPPSGRREKDEVRHEEREELRLAPLAEAIRMEARAEEEVDAIPRHPDHRRAEDGAGALFAGVVPRFGWITIGGFVFFGAYEKAQDLLWKSGAWGAKPKFML
jgi:hypothetical protein